MYKFVPLGIQLYVIYMVVHRALSTHIEVLLTPLLLPPS